MLHRRVIEFTFTKLITLYDCQSAEINKKLYFPANLARKERIAPPAPDPSRGSLM
jgi:hypothetical protein